MRGCRKGVDMLWNIGTIDTQGARGTSLSNENGPKAVQAEEFATASPAFDAWLQTYRKRLEEACKRADSRSAQWIDYR